MTKFNAKRAIMKKQFTIGLLLCILSSIICANDVKGSYLNQYDPYLSQSCGPMNMYLALKLLERSPDFEDVFALCSNNESGSSNFLQLKRAAEENGVLTFCAKMNVSALKKVKNLAILHLVEPEGGHFVVFNGFDGSNFMILDATRRIDEGMMYCINPKELSNIWDGKIMVISNDPIEAPQEGGISRMILGIGIYNLFIVVVLIKVCCVRLANNKN